MVVSVEFNSGVPVTVTVEVTVPTEREPLTVEVNPPCTRISEFANWLNPSCENVTEYFPIGSAPTRYDPSSLVSTFTSRLVAAFFTFTATLPSDAPELSVTVPLIEPNVCCAELAELNRKERSAAITAKRTNRNIEVHPSSRLRPEIKRAPSRARNDL